MPRKKQDPVRPTLPTVTIEGQEHTLKRLPASMAFDLLPMIETLFGVLSQLSSEGRGQETMAQHLVYVLRRHKDLLTSVFAHALGVKEADFNDAERFPLSTHLKLASALAEHPDLEDFLAQARELWNTATAELQTGMTSRESSEPSAETVVMQDGATSDS